MTTAFEGGHDAPPLFYSVLAFVACALALRFVIGAVRGSRLDEDEKKSWKLIPGRLPILGHAHLIPSAPLFLETLENWADKYGTDAGCYEIDLLGQRTVVVCGEDRALEILKHRPISVQRGTKFAAAADSVGGKGVLSAEGEQWKQEHRLVTAALNKKNVQDYLSEFKVVARRLVQKWSRDSAISGGSVPIDEDLGCLAADSIAKVALGQDFDSLESKKDSNQTVRDMQTSMVAFSDRLVFPFPFKYWNIPLFGQYLDGKGSAIHRVYSAANDVVLDHERNLDRNSSRTFLQKVYEVMDKTKKLSRERMVGNVITLFLAGTDTTSKALTTAFYILGKDHRLQKELQAEVDGIDLKEADLNDLLTLMPRLKSFMHEVHRWYAVPILGLKTTKDIQFGGSYLRKGIEVLVLTRYMCTSSRSSAPLGQRGSHPNKFCAHRWLVQDGSCPTPDAKVGSFLGFGYGVRRCPGKLYSEALSLEVLALVLQTFELSLAPDQSPDAKMIFDVMMTPEGGVRLTMKKRS